MKHLKFLTLSVCICFSNFTIAQIGISTDGSNPDASAMLDIKSTDSGLLIPRMTTIQRTAISSPATGLLVFDNTSTSFWFYSGSAWEDLSAETTPDRIADVDDDTYINVETIADDDVINFFAGGDPQLKIDNNVGMTILPNNGINGGVVNLKFNSWTGSNNITNTLPVSPTSPANNTMNFSINGNNTMTLLGDGGVKINNNYTLPTIDGTSGQALLTDGSGIVSWNNYVGNAIGDADDDTKIQVEESTDEDIIRFDIEGSEKLVLNENSKGYLQMQVLNNEGNIFLGKNAGQNASSVNRRNTVVGDLAGSSLTSGKVNTFIGESAGANSLVGQFNVFVGAESGSMNLSHDNTMIGYQAGKSNVIGIGNTFLGNKAGDNNNGSNNVFIGNLSGSLETGSDKLYIENSSGTPLIYGEFDNNIVQINGTATITGTTTIDNNATITGTGTIKKLKVGSSGTVISSIIKVTVSKDVPNINSNTSEWVNFSVIGAEVGAAVTISPSAQLDGKVIITQAYVSSTNSVSVNFRNVGGSGSNPPSMNYFISVIK